MTASNTRHRKSVSERPDPVQEVGDRVGAGLRVDAGQVGDSARGLDDETKLGGDPLGPAGQDPVGGHPVESVVDLDGGEPLGVVVEHLGRLQLLRVEAALPLPVAVAARADENLHGLPGGSDHPY